MSHFAKKTTTVAAVVCLAVAFMGACGGTHRSGGQQAARVGVTERNFAIDLPSTIKPGRTTFVVHGAGPSMHEFNVSRTDFDPTKLPLADDGTVDDQSPHAGFEHLVEAEGIDIGTQKTLTVDLSPGTYVLYCNMDGHYMSGMARRITVASA